MSSTIGDLVDRAARARGWGDQRVAFEIGVLPSEKVFNATQVKRLRRGERQNLSRELVARLIEVLDLPEDEAWHAAGLWPEGLSLEGYRRFRHLAAVPANGVSSRKHDDWRIPEVILPVDEGLDQQIRRLRLPPVDRELARAA